ncbi:PREDICTED: uncharacterized protein KIAA1211 homolog isoform X2 [Crocodylus porosus]|uniref:uncharacterized protein KIAA1211 homolog isoform X2 n=1 Tax=Crocodylus porosus TaxID=8502 RepID=UPI00093E5FFC|nr:PREDICTED: uncharacterized protein KIAA1211 homolog isoform X2 [Crocodylus porosus]
MGTRAFSHESIFIPDGRAESEQAIQAMSQDNILGKVKTLQSIDTPDSLSRVSLPGTGQDMEEKVTPVKSSRPKRHLSSSGTIESINLDAVPQAVARLDNSAAKHKLSVKPKKQRMSRKHRRLTKESQSVAVSEYEQESMWQYVERNPDHNGHIIANKSTQERVEQKQPNLADGKRKHEDHLRILEADKKKQVVETEETKHLEEKHQEIEEMQREEQRRRKEDRKQRLLEEEKHLKMEEQRRWEEEKKLEEEQRQQELEEQKRQEQKREIEKQHQEEEKKQEEQNLQGLMEWKRHKEQRRHNLDEKMHLEVEEKLTQEEETSRLEQHKRLEEQKQLQEKEKKTQAEQSHQVLEKHKGQKQQKKHESAEQMHFRNDERIQHGEFKKRQEEQIQEQLQENRRTHIEGQLLLEKQKGLQKSSRQENDDLHSGDASREPMEKQLQEDSRQKTKQPELKKPVEETFAEKQKREAEAKEQERIGEEIRWQEVDERQTMSRPFTFQVSSGEKQILFHKVNLSPVTPAREATLPSAIKESRAHKTSKGSHALPSSVCVPHTAILVTGAQLCGTAVNLNQIKDTACKSLLGLTEERKTMTIPPLENIQKTTSSSKLKHTQETLNNQAILAELASIRSRILKTAENKVNERDRVSACRHSDDWTARGGGGSHSNLRKTLSANAKFSITPAWQKFSDTSKGSAEAENISGTQGSELENVGKTVSLSSESNENVAVNAAVPAWTDNAPEVVREKTEVTDNTEGCKFAKDLPSFLVPSVPHSPGREAPQSESSAALESQQNNATRKLDKAGPNAEENVSPFGIKLRRTNYSLRFHYDQQMEQRKKKRYSAGDSFDGVPVPLVTVETEKESTITALNKSPAPSLVWGDAAATVLKDSSNSVMENSPTAGVPLPTPASSQISLSGPEKPVCKSPALQKPALAPKPTNQTPPSSPLSKMNRSNVPDTFGQRVAKPDLDLNWKKDDSKGNNVLPPAPIENKNEEETREKKSFFPSISIPWREKADKKPEPLKKEKPVLQSRHSLDGSKLMEKVETAQPLWITLALQKQKGFREQQATREERRQAREAKQAEKLAKENAGISNLSDNKSSNSIRTNALQKSTHQEGEKKIETAVSRLERREQLKKSNTLPTSVTVEISDSVPSTPLAKEVTKRFSTPDANPVSTEPAWLALAKRKAKAWSDCPQIIK